jgi:uncharacterized protein YndB with AHSA1/START domain
MKKTASWWLGCLASLLTHDAWAGVKETSAQGFTVETVILAEAKPVRVYADLLQPQLWWHPDHTWSGSARNLKIEARAGGCFCEKLAGGGSVQHGRVLFVKPGALLRIDGALGPLQDLAVTGILTFTLAPDAGGTRITMSYRVSGALTMDAAKLAPLVDSVMTQQLQRLRDFTSGKDLH